MAPPIKFSVTDNSKDILLAIKAMSLPVAKAAKLAIEDAGFLLKTRGRAAIRASGMGNRFANAYRVDVFPVRGKVSINAVAFARFRGLAYSDIFQTGGTIRGKPMLWLPFKTTPKLDGRTNHATPKQFAAKGVKLFSIQGRAHPLLGTTVWMSRAQASKREVKVTATNVLQHFKGNKKTKGNRLVRRFVPLFFGLNAVTIRKKFDLNAVADQVQAQVPRLYEARINQLADK